MFIHNVRYGFATNSSSAHSIVRLKKGVKPIDDYSEGFQWNYFTAASADAKRQYMGNNLIRVLIEVHHLQRKDAQIIASNWAGIEVDEELGVDHQSAIAFPCATSWGVVSVRKDFFEDLLKFILKPNIAIIGGNDNYDTVHELIANKQAKPLLNKYWEDEETGNEGWHLFTDSDSKHIRARYDATGKFWSLFNTFDGKKVRVSFVKDADAEKSEAPELVDLKITDYCESNCNFCYQGSSTKGQHADQDTIQNISYALEELEVFEVAIGGGEPTTHPNFISIIDTFHRNGIVPSFSTRNVDWVVRNWSSINEKIGAIGLSVNDCAELVQKLSKLKNLPGIDSHSFNRERIIVQVPVGSCDDCSLKKIMETCNVFRVPILLLGWKDINRGRNTKKEVNLTKVLDSFWGEPYPDHPNRKNNDNWEGPSIAFDTVLVQEMQEWLGKHADAWYFTKREGAHSMYIDAVTMQMAKSSYQKDEFMPLSATKKHLSYTELAENIKKYFVKL